MSLKQLITSCYGAEIYERTNELKIQKSKRSKLKNQIIFLNRCVVHKIIPKSFRVSSPIQTRRGKNITSKYRYELLICARNDAKSNFFKSETSIENLRNLLKVELSIDHMNIIENVTEKAASKTFAFWKNHHIYKFEKLQSNTMDNTITLPTVKPITLNLCDDDIPQHHKELLELGPKFVPINSRIPYMDIITKTEATALKIFYDKKEDTTSIKLRQDVLRDLKTTKEPKSNLTYNQRKALRELKTDNEVKIYSFDKGAGMVRIKKTDAIDKINEQIGNTEIINKDPTPTLARKFQNTLRRLKQENKFTDTEYKQLYPSDPVPPRMYGVIKAHKPEKNYPMRVVVSTIGTPSYETSKYLVKIIQPTLNTNETRLRNSQKFVDLSKDWQIDEDEVQVSYDVVNLYPSVPINDSINIMAELLSKDNNLKNRTKLSIHDIRTLIELCLSKCYFLWEEKFYQLKNSGPIGLALMVVMAEGFLQYHEKRAIELALTKNPSIAPKSFVRYFDDSHARFNNLQSAIEFKTILNNQNPNIQYTMDAEDADKTLQFLDLKIKNTEGKYVTSIFRKNAITNVQVKPHSGHDPKILKGIFTGFLHRAYAICQPTQREEEIEFLIRCFTENGYDNNELKRIAERYHQKMTSPPNNNEDQQSDEPSTTVTLPWIPGLSPKLRKSFRKAGIKAVFKSNANLKTLLTSNNKCKLPDNSLPGVYLTSCKCGKKYVGETSLKVSTRMEQHKKTIRDEKWDLTGISSHSQICKAGFDWENVKTLKVDERRFERKVREALEIQLQVTAPHSENGLNQDDGQYVTTRFWKPMFSYLREKTTH